MTSHAAHKGIFSANIIRARHQADAWVYFKEISRVRPREDNWDRAAAHTLSLLSAEFKRIRFSVRVSGVDVQGVTSDSLADAAVVKELHRALSLAISLGKEEFVLLDICPDCPLGPEGAALLRNVVEQVTEELKAALWEGGRDAVPMPAVRRQGRFDLRVYLQGPGPCRIAQDDEARSS